MDTGTSAPHQHYPKIMEAPKSSETHRPWVRDDRQSAAPDQEYPQIVEAPRHVEDLCPCCGRPR